MEKRLASLVSLVEEFYPVRVVGLWMVLFAVLVVNQGLKEEDCCFAAAPSFRSEVPEYQVGLRWTATTLVMIQVVLLPPLLARHCEDWWLELSPLLRLLSGKVSLG